MFASSVRSRALFRSRYARTPPKPPSYSAFTFKDLRRLPPDELIDTLLAAKDTWLGEREKLREQILTAEKGFHVTQSMLKDQLLASEKGFHVTQSMLKDQLLASEIMRHNASESRMQSEMELKLTKIRMRDLQISLLRNQNRFHLRGIIESIAEQPDYDTTQQLPSHRHDTQPRLDWISSFSPSYARFRQLIMKHRGIRRIDFDRSGRSLYHELSKHFHENRIPLDSNQDDIIVDMTQAYTNGVFNTLDGAVLESFLHYRYIPYTAITDGAVEQYAPAELGGDLQRTVMPLGYREELYARVLNKRDIKVDGDVDPIVSISP